jgi:cobalt-zinc-cadmium efflux system outer membrane protein
LSDSNALEDTLSGKRGLRLRVARAALAAAKLNRADAQRTLEFQVKQQYIQAVQARDSLDFALEVQKTSTQTFELTKLRYEKGAISEADEAKVETAKLEADQAVDAAAQQLRGAKVALAFLLGVRGAVPDYKVAADLPRFSVPPRLATATTESLFDEAIKTRPDLRALQAQRERAQASLTLAKRLLFPDLAINLGYSQQTGTDSAAAQPPTLSFGLGGTLPIFYFQAGEIRKAEADSRTQKLQLAKQEAQVVSDIEGAYNNFASTRRLIERMTTRLLERATRARDLVGIQYQKGSASLLELLDAQRQYIITNLEYLQDLANYWTAVFQLEQAVGTDLR